jgi:hypothetical protein
MADGNIACADFTSIQVFADQVWADNASNKQYIARCDAAKAIMQEQTAELIPLTDPEKDLTVKIQWVDMCANTVENLDPLCAFVGAEGEITCDEKTITVAKQSVYSITENKFRGSTADIQMMIAKGWLTAKKLLDEEIAKDAIAKVNGFVGVNEYTGAPGQVSGTDTFIPPAHWGPEIMAYFAQVSIINSSADVYILDGDNLFRQTWLAQFKALNANQKDGAAMLDTIRTYHDLFNMGAIVGPNELFLIDRSAVSIVTKNRYSSSPRNIVNGADRIRFSVPSDNLQGVVYDVVYTTECLANEDIRHNWKFIARFDTFLNPTSACNATNTGVLSFTCGVAP